MANLDEKKIASIVEAVLLRLDGELQGAKGGKPSSESAGSGKYHGCAPPPPRASERAAQPTGGAARYSSATYGAAGAGKEGVFGDMDAAVEAATKAQAALEALPLETRKAVIQAMRDVGVREAETLSRMAVDETKLGRVDDKIIKNRLATLKTPGVEDLQTRAESGDHGLTIHELAPLGVLCSITPTTNPTETILNNGISMLAAGNSVVFNTHPSAKGVSGYLIQALNRGIVSAGGPANLLCCMESPTIETAQGLMKHAGIRTVVVTGGPAVVKQALQSGKRAICAGPGNPPVVVDETANLAKAGKGIVSGASFDNNVICVDEKEVIAVAEIADQLKREMQKNHAYELKGREIEKVMKVVLSPDGHGPAKDWVGKDATKIAAAAGITVPSSTRLLFAEVDSEEHPFIHDELLLPTIGFIRVKHVDEAIAMAVRVEHGFRHSASIYSTSIESMHKMAVAMDCSIFIKNGPHYNGLGQGGESHTAWTIAGTTGEGVTSARTFTRLRRCVLVDYFRIV
jgi:acyl-CoA reductase-like NAD-dependent aldehyde dehydrogenase